MALEKSSKKTQKSATVSKSKAKPAAATKTNSAVGIEEASATETRRKSPSAVNMNSTLQTGKAETREGLVKTMAAGAGHSAVEYSKIESAAATETVAVGHSPAYPTYKGITRELIAQRAYFYWAERDFAPGSADEDWVRAEMDLAGRN